MLLTFCKPYLFCRQRWHSLKQGLGPRTRDPGSETQDPEHGTQDPGPRTQDPGPRTRNLVPGNQDAGPRTQDPGPKTWVLGLKAQDSGLRTHDSKIWDPGTLNFFIELQLQNKTLRNKKSLTSKRNNTK